MRRDDGKQRFCSRVCVWGSAGRTERDACTAVFIDHARARGEGRARNLASLQSLPAMRIRTGRVFAGRGVSAFGSSHGGAHGYCCKARSGEQHVQAAASEPAGRRGYIQGRTASASSPSGVLAACLLARLASFFFRFASARRWWRQRARCKQAAPQTPCPPNTLCLRVLHVLANPSAQTDGGAYIIRAWFAAPRCD